MQWLQSLALLACPLMVIACMIGLFSAGRGSKKTSSTDVTAQEIQRLQIQMAELIEQNQKLKMQMEATDQDPDTLPTMKRSG
jgi:hypothetical protein